MAVLAGGRDVAQRLGRDREPVADAAAGDDDVVGAADGDLAGEEGDHQTHRPSGGGASRPPRRASAAVIGAALAWQIATASASAAWSGRGSSASASRRLDHALDLVPCPRGPEPQTAPLTCWGV